MSIRIVFSVFVLLLSLSNGEQISQISFEDLIPGYPSPKLHPLLDQHVLNSGETWTLRCSGKFPLEWVLPTADRIDADPNMMERVTITEEVIPGDNPRPHISYLVIKDLVYLDTGRYMCRYVDTTDNNLHDNVTSTYLFASDPNELMDISSKMVFVNVPQYQETHIACRPTSPEVKMSFFKEEADISDKLQAMLLRYDPKIGLIIVEGRIAYHSGLIECRATRNGTEQKLVAFLTYRPVPQYLPTPYIEDPDQIGHPVIGGKLSLICRVNVEYTDAYIELVWGFPDKEKAEQAIKSERIQILKQERTVDKSGSFHDPSNAYVNNVNSQTFYSRQIIINKLEQSDVGAYTCHSAIGGSKSSSHTFYLQNVRKDEKDPFIGNADFQGHPTISVDSSHGKRPVQWIFTLFATPDPTYLWLNPKGGELDFAQLEKYEMDVDVKTGKVKLVINELDFSDTGHYVFHVEVQGGEGEIVKKDVDLYLKYSRDPRVTLSSTVEASGGLFLSSRSSYQLNCLAEGFPLDMEHMEWSFSPCKAFGDCSANTEIVKSDFVLPDDDVIDEDYHYRYISGLNASTSKSGVYSCKVCRKSDPDFITPIIHCNKSSLNFFISEYQDGFSIVRPSDSGKIIIGDSIEVTCGVSIYKYKSVQWFKKDLKKPDEWKAVVDVPAIKLLQNNSEFSISSTMLFDAIQQSDDGIYQCRADPISPSSVAQKDVRIRVWPTVPPQRSASNNVNDTEATVEMSKEIYLDCSAEGTPFPTIEWFKDGEPLPNQFLGNSSNDELQSSGSVLHIAFALSKHSGKYECVATNRAGSFRSFIDLTVKEPVPVGLIIGIVAAIVIVIVLSIILVWKVRAYDEKYKELTKFEVDRFRAGDPASINSELGVDDQAELLPYNEKYEFPRDKLVMGKMLGSGAFGRVMKATAEGIVPWESSTVVAVKMLKTKPYGDHDYLKTLMVELKIMIHLGKHINILNVLGACTTNLRKRELLVITEYCRFGNIQKYLVCHRPYFVNQVNSETGGIDYDIGSEEYGSSIPYSNHHKSINRAPSTASGRKSVRYTIQPKHNRADSMQSDYLEDGQIVVTGMTTLPPDGGDISDERRRLRSLSSMSNEPGPIWGANVGGDYDQRSMKPMFTKDLICWSYQVVRGMDYLTSKKVMHGDLACRNILLASNNVIKICDFGLAKDMYKNSTYQKKSSGPLPIKWMAVESLKDRLFSTQSDVWSFGIVLWEMFTLGRVPYPGIEAGEILVDKIFSGYRMDKPEYCPNNIYKIMLDCWHDSPNARPTFAKLEKDFGALLESTDKNVYVEQCRQFDGNVAKLRGSLVKSASEDVENRDYLAMMSPPNYNTQTSVRPSLSLEQLVQSECGYLIPNPGPGPSMSNDGYLMPDNKLQQSTSIAIDNEGYLLASPLPVTSNGGQTEAKTFEEWPMLKSKDNGNVISY